MPPLHVFSWTTNRDLFLLPYIPKDLDFNDYVLEAQGVSDSVLADERLRYYVINPISYKIDLPKKARGINIEILTRKTFAQEFMDELFDGNLDKTGKQVEIIVLEMDMTLTSPVSWIKAIIVDVDYDTMTAHPTDPSDYGPKHQAIIDFMIARGYQYRVE